MKVIFSQSLPYNNDELLSIQNKDYLQTKDNFYLSSDEGGNIICHQSTISPNCVFTIEPIPNSKQLTFSIQNSDGKYPSFQPDSTDKFISTTTVGSKESIIFVYPE
jgi:hypothetical protein